MAILTTCGTFHVLLRQRLRPEVIVAKLRETDEALNSYGADQRQSSRPPLQAMPTRPALVRLSR